MTIQVNTGKAELLFVKVPDDAHDIDYRNGVNLLSWQTKHSKSAHGIDFFDTDGDWQIIGFADKLTEEHCEPLVESIYELSLQKITYKCYTQHGVYLSAKESFESLMEANEIYSVNPEGEFEPMRSYHMFMSKYQFEDLLLDWRKAEERTGKYLVLKQKDNA